MKRIVSLAACALAFARLAANQAHEDMRQPTGNASRPPITRMDYPDADLVYLDDVTRPLGFPGGASE